MNKVYHHSYLTDELRKAPGNKHPVTSGTTSRCTLVPAVSPVTRVLGLGSDAPLVPLTRFGARLAALWTNSSVCHGRPAGRVGSGPVAGGGFGGFGGFGSGGAGPGSPLAAGSEGGALRPGAPLTPAARRRTPRAARRAAFTHRGRLQLRARPGHRAHLHRSAPLQGFT